MAVNLDQRAVLRGATAYLAVAIPCGIIIGVLGPDDQSFLWILAAVAVILVAPLVGGAVAGSTQPRAAITQAAAAVGIPATIFLIGRIIYDAAQGTLSAEAVVSFALYLAVFIGLGMAGGYVAFRRHMESS